MTDMREAFEKITLPNLRNNDDALINDHWQTFQEAWQAAHAQGVKEGLEMAKKECNLVSNYYFNCAEDALPDEYECADIAGGADLCASAIQQLIDKGV